MKTAALAWMAVAALACAGPAPCADLWLQSVTVAPETGLLLAVNFASQSGSVTGLQFDLQYDPYAVNLTATLGEAGRNAGKRLYVLDPALGRRRFLITGLNANPIPDGALLNLFVSVKAEAAEGDYPLQLLDIAATNETGGSAAVTGTDGLISVQGAPGSGLRLRSSGVLNGASLLPGPVSPGEILALIGAGIGLGSTGVLFDGIPAPLLYAASDRIHAIAPYGIQANSSTKIRVMRGEKEILAEVQLSVVEASPAIFTVDGSGAGQGIALNQDSAANSPANPAEKGSTVTLFATGAGQTDPPGADGQIAGDILPKPVLPVTVQIGGVNAEVLSAEAVPGMVAGMLRVSCAVPFDAPSGYAVPVALSVGEFQSQAGVTIAIQ